MKCEYCGNHLGYEISQCPSCGGLCPYVPRPTEKTVVEISPNHPPEPELKPQKTRIPISDVNVDFLKQNQQVRINAEKSSHSGCAAAALIVIFIILIAIASAAMA